MLALLPLQKDNLEAQEVIGRLDLEDRANAAAGSLTSVNLIRVLIETARTTHDICKVL